MNSIEVKRSPVQIRIPRGTVKDPKIGSVELGDSYLSFELEEDKARELFYALKVALGIVDQNLVFPPFQRDPWSQPLYQQPSIICKSGEESSGTVKMSGEKTF